MDVSKECLDYIYKMNSEWKIGDLAKVTKVSEDMPSVKIGDIVKIVEIEDKEYILRFDKDCICAIDKTREYCDIVCMKKCIRIKPVDEKASYKTAWSCDIVFEKI